MAKKKSKLARVEIKCTEPGCDATRLIHHASIKETTRCCGCQEEAKRRKGRERYRRRKGLPIEDHLQNQNQKDEYVEEVKKAHESAWENIGPRDPDAPKPKTRPEEQSSEMLGRIASLLDMTGDDATDDDW
tara:strand:- start:109917 stop:110309 length:393 start_codon:yes stop_codon:yes gene_type:complete